MGIMSPFKNLLGEVGLTIGLSSPLALPPALDGNTGYDHIAKLPTFRSRVTPSSRINHILSTLRRRGVQVYVSPEEMDAVDNRSISRLGLTAEHASDAACFWQSHARQMPGATRPAVREGKSPLIWLNLAKHGYGAGGTPNEDELVYTLLHETISAMTVLLGHEPLDNSASPRDRHLRELSILHGRGYILEWMGMDPLLERNKTAVSSYSRRVRSKSELIAAKTLGMRAADHFHATPNIIALMRDKDGNSKNIPQRRAFALMDLLERHNLPRNTTLAELSVMTDHATKSFVAELSYWDGMTKAERDYHSIQALIPEDGLGH